MYTKILLVVIIFILSAFFYLHTQNPGVITFVVTKDHTYIIPATLLLFAGFFAGAMFAVLNSLLVDAKRAIREMRERREKKLVAMAEENYREGIEDFVKGDINGARASLEKALKARPNDTKVIISLSETYIRENRIKEALKILEGSYNSNPGSIGILMAISKYSAESGDVVKSAKALEDILQIDARNTHALRKLRDYRMDQGLWTEAAALQKSVLDCKLDEFTKKKEKNLLTGILFEAARKYVDEGRLSDSVARIKEVLKNDESFMPAHVLLGEVLLKQGNASNAVKVWEKARNKYSGSEPIFLMLEDAYIQESAPERILEKYKKEISSNPNNTNLRLLLSRLYLRLEMVDNAIEELERLQLDGEDTFYHQVLLGEAYLRRKQNNKAAQLFQKALGFDREFQPPFTCSRCGNMEKSWTPRCPSCGEWNTLSMNSSGSKHSSPASLSARAKL